jgi:hypothetical protein
MACNFGTFAGSGMSTNTSIAVSKQLTTGAVNKGILGFQTTRELREN